MEDGLMMLNLTGLQVEESDRIVNPVMFEQAHIIEFMEFNDGLPNAEQIRQRVEGLLSIIGLELGLEVVADIDGLCRIDGEGVNPDFGVLIGGPLLPQFMVSQLELSIVDQIGIRVMYPVLEVRTTADQEKEVVLVGIVEPQAEYEELEADQDEDGDGFANET
jgi:hypothetical protein